MALSFIALLSITLVVSVYAGHSGREEDEDWAHMEFLDKEGKYKVYWTANKKSIEFKVEVATKGWVGFGLSPDGQWPKSDIAIGWKKGKEQYLYDYHTDAGGELVIDKSQDWKLLSSSENKSHTILRFTRYLDTCDFGDQPILNGSHPIAYAFSDDQPNTPYDFQGLYRPFQKMWKIQYVQLLQPRFIMIPKPRDVRHWDVRADKVTLPRVETFFHCKFVRAPQLKKKHHVIKFSPIVTPGNKRNIIYMTVNPCAMECGEEIGRLVSSQNQLDCFDPSLADISLRCFNFLHIWLARSKGIVYPQQAGAPFGTGDPEFYVLINMYYNPELRSDIVDSSGVRLYYTPNLRKYDSAGVWVPGLHLGPLAVIPPRQEKFTLTVPSPLECLTEGIPKDGIKVFGLHNFAMTLARRIKIRHFRGNVELPYLFDQDNYNVFDNEIFYFENSVTILPGDQLVYECTFNSMKRNFTTLGSPYMSGDFCGALLYHYPPAFYRRILTSPRLELIAGLTGMNLTSGNYNVIIQQGAVGRGTPEYMKYLEKYDWTHERICALQDAIKYSPQFSTCSTPNETIVYVREVNFPTNFIPYRPPDRCRKFKNYWLRKRRENLKDQCEKRVI